MVLCSCVHVGRLDEILTGLDVHSLYRVLSAIT